MTSILLLVLAQTVTPMRLAQVNPDGGPIVAVRVVGSVTTAAPALQMVAVDGGYVYARQGTTPWTVDGTVTVTDGSGPITVDGTLTCNAGTGTLAVSAASLPLPSGASTSALQSTGNSSLSSIDGKLPALVSSRVPVDGSGVTQPVSGTVAATQSGSWSLAANQSVNVAQLNGVAPTMGNGASGTGVQRVTIANDSTGVLACTQSGSWSLAANQSTNVAQINGVTVTMGNGASGTGVQRVTLANDSTGTVAATQSGSWSLAANQSTNVAQFGGTNVSTGTGTGGAGIPRVTISSDSSLAANQSVNVAQANGVAMLMGAGATGTGSIRVTLATDTVAQATASSLNAQVVGAVAHDGVVGANPLLIGGYAETAEDSDANTNSNRVSADGDVVRSLHDRNGTVFVRFGPPHSWQYHENSSNALTDTTVHASCGTGLYNYITSITFSTGAATAASILIEDSTNTTILGPYYLEAVAGRGLTVRYPEGKKQTNSATLISVTTTGAIAHGLDITGFCAP